MRTKVMVFLVLICGLIPASSLYAFETHRTSSILRNNILSLNVIANQLGQGIHDNLATHPWLTTKAVDASVGGGSIGTAGRTEIVLGSIAEDFDLSMNISQSPAGYNHYTEFPNEGIVLLPYGYYLPALNPQDAIHSDRAQNHFFSGGYNLTTPNGQAGRLNDKKLLDSQVANTFFNLSEDRESAVYWALHSSINGAGISNINAQTSTSRKMRILGHVLHLLEDMGVPDHVRDDAHASKVVGIDVARLGGNSIYEERLGELTFEQHEAWAAGIPSMAPEPRTELATYFLELSDFTRTHFFSSDTIFSTTAGMSLEPNYSNWNFNNLIGSDRYVTGQIGGSDVRLARYNWLGRLRHTPYTVTLGGFSITTIQIPYPQTYAEAVAESDYFNVDDEGIVRDYWRVMKPHILAYCAGFIDRFMAIYAPPPPPPPPSPGPWAKTYGGDVGDYGKYIQQTLDDGFIVAGSSEGKIWVLKLNSDGTVLWQKSYSDNNYSFTAVSIRQTLDGGFILGGASVNNTLLIKINTFGAIEWSKLLLASPGNFSMIQTSDGGYMFGFYGNYDGVKSIQGVLLIKLDEYGSIAWQRSYISSQLYTIFRIYGTDAIRQINDGGYIIAGNNDYFNPWIMKINPSGDIIWNSLYAFGFSGRFSSARSILQETNGDYLFTGSIQGASRDEYNVFMIKIDSNGLNPICHEYNGGVASSINKTNDGGYVIVGEKNFNSGPNYSISGLVLLKIDQSGVPILRHTYGTSYGSGYQLYGTYGIPTRDGGYVATGSYLSSTIYGFDVFVLKLPENGNIAFNSSSQLFDTIDSTNYSIWPVSTSSISLISESSNISFTSPNIISSDINIAISTQAP